MTRIRGRQQKRDLQKKSKSGKNKFQTLITNENRFQNEIGKKNSNPNFEIEIENPITNENRKIKIRNQITNKIKIKPRSIHPNPEIKITIHKNTNLT